MADREPNEPPDGHPMRNSETEAIEITREESRAVVDHQIEEIRRADDKTLHLVRTAVILLGLIISAANIAGGDAVQNLSIGVFASIAVSSVFLTLAIVVGTIAISVTDPPYGIGDKHREAVVNGQRQRRWNRYLLLEYSRLTSVLETEVTRTRRLLNAVQVLLLLGLLALILSPVLLYLQ